MPMTEIDWRSVRRVLVVRLRSIGDTVLSTPSLIALRRHLPKARIDVLLEDWVAPLVESFDAVDSVIRVDGGRGGRLKAAWRVRQNAYDVAINLHGGTTSTFLTRASGARYRIGYSHYQYSFLYNRLLRSASDFWGVERTHSAEQQLALPGFVGIPVEDRPRSRLPIQERARASLGRKFSSNGDYALIHPASTLFTKQWSTANFSEVVEHLSAKGIRSVAIASGNERSVLQELRRSSPSGLTTLDDLSLPEVSVLASGASVFVGNDSGIAHVAAAVGTPTVVVFGSSNRDHWRPWTDAPNEIVFNAFDCQPCPGYECRAFGAPRCILSIGADQVIGAVDRVLMMTKKGEPQPALSSV